MPSKSYTPPNDSGHPTMNDHADAVHPVGVKNTERFADVQRRILNPNGVAAPRAAKLASTPQAAPAAQVSPLQAFGEINRRLNGGK